MRKYQEGGQLTDTQQQGLQYLAQMYAQQTGKDPQLDQEGFMLFIQQLAQQAGVQDIGQLLDMIYQQALGQAQAAKRGAKLNYLKRLSGRCPEGYEMEYFKAGGKVCSKCVAKKDKCGSKIKKKACGSKIKKGLLGLIFPYAYKNNPAFRKFINKGVQYGDAALNPNRPETSDWIMKGYEDLGDGRGIENWYNEYTGESKQVSSSNTLGGLVRNIFGTNPPKVKSSPKNSNTSITRPGGGIRRSLDGTYYGRPSSLREVPVLLKQSGGSLNGIPFNLRGNKIKRYKGKGGSSSRYGGQDYVLRGEDAGDSYGRVRDTKDGFVVRDDVGIAFKTDINGHAYPIGYYGTNGYVYTPDGRVLDVGSNLEISKEEYKNIRISPIFMYNWLKQHYNDYKSGKYGIPYYDREDLHEGGNQRGGVR